MEEDKQDAHRKIKDLRVKRGTCKTKVTKYLSKLKPLSEATELDVHSFRNHKSVLDSLLEEVKRYDALIIFNIEGLSPEEGGETILSDEIEEQTEYHFSVQEQIIDLDPSPDATKVDSTGIGDRTHTSEFLEVLQSFQVDARPPTLQCSTFSGLDDRLEYRNFYVQFKNLIDSKRNLSGAAKLTYLRGYLRGYALKVIAHLPITDDSYLVAIQLLNEEFYDVSQIIDDIFKTILTLSPKYDPSFQQTRIYINEIRSLVHELKCCRLDFLKDGSPGCMILSHIVISKLPLLIRRELNRIVGSNYPSINELFDHYNDLIKGLIKTSRSPIKDESESGGVRPKSKGQSFAKRDSALNPHTPTLQNFKISNSETFKSDKSYFNNKPCKFCSVAGHSMFKCPKYVEHYQRISKCKDIGLCIYCSSSKHDEKSCPGLEHKLSFVCSVCNKRTHISALCPKLPKIQSETVSTNPFVSVCLNSSNIREKQYLLPTLTVRIGRGNSYCFVRCLIDTGSQRSYFSHNVMHRLNLKLDKSREILYDVRTFLESKSKILSENMMEIYLEESSKLDLPVLIDSDLQVHLNLPDMDQVVNNLVSKGYQLADFSFDNFKSNRDVVLEGILGVDVLQFLPELSLRKVLNGSAFTVNGKIIPFGNLESFLYPNQLNAVNPRKPISINQLEEDPQLSSYINFVMSPVKTYFSPLESIFEESLVEQGIDNIFKLESIGIHENSTISVEEKAIMDKFGEGIEFKDGKYHVELPWHEDKVKNVPSNHNICLAVLKRTYRALEIQGLVKAYDQVFQQQLLEGIIEPFEVVPEEYGKYVWVPHRAVIRNADQITTKVRAVFNCSLKVGNTPSLNEAAFKGIDLMSQLTDLLLYFRTNKFTLLSDIKQAFLQIKLKNLNDRNRFCFFWIDQEGNLVHFRYTTIVFGYTSSPFILNYIIKYHVGKYVRDEVSKILMTRFYVDNLIVTSNSEVFLKDVYIESVKRMKKGGFELRSWQTNEPHLAQNLSKDGSRVSHDKPYEKVLGYNYYPSTDEMQLAEFSFDSLVNTKRGVLSQIAKVFDPLGVFLPVTVRGRSLMRELWLNNLEWDQHISLSMQTLWNNLSIDLCKLKSFKFSRNAIDSFGNTLCVFCDAAKTSYGFVSYAVNNQQSNLIFAKSKVSPIKPRSIPTLELLSVYLALKCLPSVFGSYPEHMFTEVFLAVDSQIALSWVLSGETKTKNVFVKNRIADIRVMIAQFKGKYGISIKLKYVSSDNNPADLLTRGVKEKELSDNWNFWYRGPTWLCGSEIKWPISNLDCLSKESKLQTLDSSLCDVNLSTVTALPENASQVSPILNLNKFSSFHKLFKVTRIVFSFVNNSRKQSVDLNRLSKLYWLKQMQKESFEPELEYLQGNDKSKVPPLVNQLNLFLDSEGLIRSKGRISKTLYYSFDVLNPVLLAPKHYLTKLLIEDFHFRCKHLGLQTTVNLIRTSGFWVPRARQVVKNIISKCLTCQKFNSFSFRYPKMTDMPRDRMNLVRPFEHTGMDYTGHLYVKDLETNKPVKMYVLLYTCLNIRAIYLDLIPDMSTSSFLMSFLRFSNLYGIPASIYTDNAKSFLAGGKILADALSSSAFKEHLEYQGIKHIKLPVYSAWVGACWERLIKVVKSCLYKTIGRATLTYFELLTVLSDVQLAVNSRPLTYRTSDNDLEAITPNCFLRVCGNSSLILRENISMWDESPSQSDLENALDKRREVFDKFRNLWYENYLLSLREHSRNLHETDWENKVKVNDIVLIKLPNKSRPFWQMGRIIELIVGYDNKVRSVRLKRGDGQICHHSLKHLYPLELSLTHSGNGKVNESVDEEPQGSDVETQNPTSNEDSNFPIASQDDVGKPRRAAAQKCRAFIRSKLHDL